MPTEYVRLFVLANQIGVTTGELIAICRSLGYSKVSNQLQALEPGQVTKIIQFISSQKLDANSPSAHAAHPHVNRTNGRIHIQGRAQLAKAPRAYPGIERLLSVGARLDLIKIEVIPRLAEVDPEAAFFKLRKLAERICRKFLQPSPPKSLDEMIKAIEANRLLSKKATAYLDTIRKLGNTAVHDTDDPFDNEFSMDEVNLMCESLSYVISEANKRGLV
jgi:hypothetical protein